jgi:hypothetical protein
MRNLVKEKNALNSTRQDAPAKQAHSCHFDESVSLRSQWQSPRRREEDIRCSNWDGNGKGHVERGLCLA